MGTYNLSNARMYVSTYAKYNKGSLAGKWLTLSDYSNEEEFYAVLYTLHKDEKYPEFMFNDWENIPDAPEELIGESYLYEGIFDLIKEIEDLTDTEQEAFFVWLNYKSIDFTKKDAYDLIRIFKDDYVGEYDDEEDFAYMIIKECYPEINGFAETYFDYSKFARDLFISDYYFENGFVFLR